MKHKLSVLVAIVLLAFAARTVRAGTITVTSTADDGSPGTLRWAIASATSGDTINFNLSYPATITLSSPLTVSTNLAISGPGASSLAVSGNFTSKVFVIAPGTTAVISGVTVENGIWGPCCAADVYSSGGGGIQNNGTLTLRSVTVSNNGGAFGGGINNEGALTVEDGLLTGNSSCCGLAAGGIFNGGVLTVTRSVFSGNHGYYDGGGILNAGTATVTSSTFSGNFADHGAGGGIKNNGALLTVANSTFVGNAANNPMVGWGVGGGISDGGGGYGGGGTVIISNTTFSGNSAGAGGGIAAITGTTTLKSVLLGANPSGGNCAVGLGGGTALSDGYNLSDDATCLGTLTATRDLNNTPAGLDPGGLQNNGGPTPTIALFATSPAVDAIPTSACTDVNGNPVSTDQRGVARPQGSGCDIGAYELIAPANEGVPAGAACVAPPANMVAWWPADGTANDIVGGNNGALENGATFASGAVSQAFSLNGVNQYVDAGNGPSLAVSSGDFSVDAWVKFDTLGGLAPTCPGGGGSNCDMSIADKMGDAAGVNTNGWRLIKQADNHFWFCLGGGGFNGCTPGGPLTVRSNTVAATGQWYLVAGVKSGNTISIYLNGALEATQPLGSGFLDTNSTDLLLGANATEGADLDGEIDEVEVSSRALNGSEIQALWDAGTSGKCKPATTTTTLTSSANPVILNQSITLTATVAPTAGGTPTGTVSFTDTTASTTLGSAPLSGGQASISVSTLTVGTHSITAAYGGDGHFLPSSGALSQQVTYGVCLLYDQTKAVNSGAVFPIKLDLCDVNGNDVSSSGIVVHAVQVTAISGNSGDPETVGNANPDLDFRFDSTLGTTGGYIFNLGTSGLASGTYSLQFTASGDPVTHSVTFGVK